MTGCGWGLSAGAAFGIDHAGFYGHVVVGNVAVLRSHRVRQPHLLPQRARGIAQPRRQAILRRDARGPHHAARVDRAARGARAARLRPARARGLGAATLRRRSRGGRQVPARVSTWRPLRDRRLTRRVRGTSRGVGISGSADPRVAARLQPAMRARRGGASAGQGCDTIARAAVLRDRGRSGDYLFVRRAA